MSSFFISCDINFTVVVDNKKRMLFKMAERIRNPSWKEDDSLKSSLKTYVSQVLQRKEILNFMVRDFGRV